MDIYIYIQRGGKEHWNKAGKLNIKQVNALLDNEILFLSFLLSRNHMHLYNYLYFMSFL